MADKSKRRRRILSIAAAVLVFLILANLAATALVYGSVFVRWEGESPEGGEVHTFMSGENELSGRLYAGGKSVLVVISQGFRSVQAKYAPVAEALSAEGFSVFTFDPTGVGGSGGESQIGFPQMIRDLEACLDFVEEQGRFGCEKLAVLGHSRGAHAACCLAGRVDAVIAFGAPATVMDAIMLTSSSSIGSIAYANRPFLWLWQALVFGPELASADAVRAIASCDTPVLVIQGSEDAVVPADYASVYSRRGELSDDPNAECLLVPFGHVDSLYYADGRVNAEVAEKAARFLRGEEE